MQYNIDRTLTGRIYLILFNTPIYLLTLLETTLVCSFHFKFSLMMTPTNVVDTTLVITVSSIVRTFLLYFSLCQKHYNLFSLKLSDSLLALNHSVWFINSLLNISKQSILLSQIRYLYHLQIE